MKTKGYEIQYYLRGSGYITEYVYASFPHQAVDIVSAKYKGSPKLDGTPVWTGNTIDPQADADEAKRVRQQQELNNKTPKTDQADDEISFTAIMFFIVLGIIYVIYKSIN